MNVESLVVSDAVGNRSSGQHLQRLIQPTSHSHPKAYWVAHRALSGSCLFSKGDIRWSTPARWSAFSGMVVNDYQQLHLRTDDHHRVVSTTRIAAPNTRSTHTGGHCEKLDFAAR